MDAPRQASWLAGGAGTPLVKLTRGPQLAGRFVLSTNSRTSLMPVRFGIGTASINEYLVGAIELKPVDVCDAGDRATHTV